jgi:hypothetical protein
MLNRLADTCVGEIWTKRLDLFGKWAGMSEVDRGVYPRKVKK